MANILSFPGRAAMMMRDTLVNMVTSLGTHLDKSTHSQYVHIPLTRVELDSMYRSDWIARKVVDIPAQDATREWRQWQAEAVDITKIEKIEKQFNIEGKAQQAMVMARLYGGAALILGVDGSGSEQDELVPDRIRQGSLKYVHAVHRYELNANELELDIASPYYRRPKSYSISTGLGVLVNIHPSRVIRFVGNEIVDHAMAIDGWGDSILQSVNDAVRGASRTAGAIATLVEDCTVDIFKIPDLSAHLSTDEYAERTTKRWALAKQLKSTVNALLIDKEEEHDRIQTNFANLPELLNTYMLLAAGAADIPATRMLSQSPKGMNATGDSDTRNYYDKVKSDQKSSLTPALAVLDDVLIRNALGKRPEEITYEWNPLWQMTEAEAADLAFKKAQVYQIDVGTGLIDSVVLGEARTNQLIEDDFYPGLELILEAQDQGELQTEMEQQIEQNKQQGLLPHGGVPPQDLPKPQLQNGK